MQFIFKKYLFCKLHLQSILKNLIRNDCAWAWHICIGLENLSHSITCQRRERILVQGIFANVSLENVKTFITYFTLLYIFSLN